MMIGSPFIQTQNNSVQRTMFKVMAALVPGVMTHAWFFGPGIWVSLLVCSVFAIAFEALALLMRNYPLKPFLSDGSALVTAWLFALSVPTLAPWWIYAIGMLFAVMVAKHLYGGLGQNPFNPAMVGYAVLIISFPMYMTQWSAPVGLAAHTPDIVEAFDLVFAGPGAVSPDAYTSASPLDAVKTQLLAGKTLDEAMPVKHYGYLSGLDGEMVVLMYLFGGLLLLSNRLITWHVPVAFLGAVAATAWGLQLIDPSRHAGPDFHLLSGGAVLGAFFIATDPVSGCTTPLGKLIFAGLAGFLTVIIRTFGGFPDGVAFSILILNVAAPFIDAYTQPRVFGHEHAGRNSKEADK